jgi:general secretion pathway protein F
LVEARVPIDKALRLLDGITESPAMRDLVLNLLREVKEGKSLAEAMEIYPAIFSKMYVNIVRAGEEGGILDELLPDLAEFLEVSAKTRQQVISAMIYPALFQFFCCLYLSYHNLQRCLRMPVLRFLPQQHSYFH